VFNTPILFIIFNRPKTTERVFTEIRKQKPKYLFIASDGPRDNNASDLDLCKQCRDIVAKIDWDCDVKTLFSAVNQGCKYAVSSAIAWFFTLVEAGIILEDDCLPNGSFFNFCETLLTKYKDDKQVMMISGTSYQKKPLNNNSYYFSKYVHIWGWATWKRAWALYDRDIKGFENDVDPILKRNFNLTRERKQWLNNFNMIFNGLDTWDYQWMYCIWKNNGIAIIPWKNMISNIGFGPGATHTLSIGSSQSEMQRFELEKIIYPENIAVDKKADRLERYSIIIDRPFVYQKAKLFSNIKKILKHTPLKKFFNY